MSETGGQMTEQPSSCAFTGHRPGRFSFEYDESDRRCQIFKKTLRGQILQLVELGISSFYTGMAMGVDQWAASEVLVAKEIHPHVRLIAVRPCETQAYRWSKAQKKQYSDILSSCDEVITLNTYYTPYCMFERNRYLVDHADYVLAVFDGESKGGTAYTLQYARQRNKKIIVIHPELERD